MARRNASLLRSVIPLGVLIVALLPAPALARSGDESARPAKSPRFEAWRISQDTHGVQRLDDGVLAGTGSRYEARFLPAGMGDVGGEIVRASCRERV